jgi:hypothetical protein
MTRSEWLEKNFKHVTFEETVGNLRVPKINVDLTYGLISTESKEEFSKLVFHLMPSGTVVDEIPDEFYEGKILLLRNMLTKMLMEEPNHKMADRYLNILERRDKNHWSKESKQLKVEQKEDKNLSITFDIV